MRLYLLFVNSLGLLVNITIPKKGNDVLDHLDGKWIPVAG